MPIGTILQTVPKKRQSIGLALQQAIGFLEMSNAALAAALRREADRIPGLSLTTAEIAAPPESLVQHVVGQIDLVISCPQEREIALAFLDELEPTGWLGVSVFEISSGLDIEESTARITLEKLQSIEPAGLFATSLADCLGLQAKDRELMSPVLESVLTHLHLFTSGGVAGLARVASLDQSDVTTALETLRQFDPKPGLQFAVHNPGLLRVHDLEMTDDGAVEFNSDSLPTIEVDAAAPAAAHRIAKLLAHRNRLVIGVATAIVDRQRNWINGHDNTLLPLRRIDVARKAGVHECTVSRIASAMTLKTGRGVQDLASFFARPLAGTSHSHDALQGKITQIIMRENPESPLSDVNIARQLKAQGMSIARRSVARHRAKAGIAAAPARRIHA